MLNHASSGRMDVVDRNKQGAVATLSCLGTPTTAMTVSYRTSQVQTLRAQDVIAGAARHIHTSSVLVAKRSLSSTRRALMPCSCTYCVMVSSTALEALKP